MTDFEKEKLAKELNETMMNILDREAKSRGVDTSRFAENDQYKRLKQHAEENVAHFIGRVDIFLHFEIANQAFG